MQAVRFTIAGATRVVCLPPARAQDGVAIHPALQGPLLYVSASF
jgi:hypothetical protein